MAGLAFLSVCQSSLRQKSRTYVVNDRHDPPRETERIQIKFEIKNVKNEAIQNSLSTSAVYHKG